jgi:hypothetical protein
MEALRQVTAPYVLCITGLDAALDVEDSMAHMLKKSADERLCAFVHAVFTRRVAAGSSEGGLCGAEESMGGVVVVGCTCSSLELLGADVLEHFPQHLATTTATGATDSSNSMGDETCGVEASLLDSACRAQAELLGRLHTAHFAQELRLAGLQRSRGASWEREAFSSGLTGPWPEPVAPVSRLGSADVARVHSSSQQGRWGVRQAPGQGQGGDGASKVSAGKDVAAVRWDDIGGVERWALGRQGGGNAA